MSEQHGKLVQIADRRREKQEAIRRDYERVLFRHVLGCYTIIEKLGLRAVEMLDVSKSGCSFRMPSEEGSYNVGEDVDFRFYFSNATYLPSRLNVKRVTKVEENGRSYTLYGCLFDSTLTTHAALEKFVDFIHAYSECAKEDKGDRQTWYL